MALRLGEYADVHAVCAVYHRRVFVDGIQRQLRRRMGVGQLHPKRDERRLAAARYPSLDGAVHAGAAAAAPDAGRDRWCVQGTARGELLVRRPAAAAGAGPVTDRLPVAVGSKGFLGHQGRHQPDQPGSVHWARDAKARDRRHRVWASHFDAFFCAACRRVARPTGATDRRAHLSVPPSRHHAGRTEAQARRLLLARSGFQGCRGLSRSDDGGDGGGILGARRAFGFAGRPVRAVFRRAAGLVFPVLIPISQAAVFRWRERGLGCHLHPGDSRRTDLPDAVYRPLEARARVQHWHYFCVPRWRRRTHISGQAGGCHRAEQCHVSQGRAC